MVKKPSGSLLYRYCDTKIEDITLLKNI